jgi:hypothetical protein
MRHRRTRHNVLWALAALLPALQACYEYAPIATSTLPVGQQVELQITDRGRVGLGDRFGPGVQQIFGRVVSEQGNDVVISVKSVTNISGESTQWSGDTTRVDRSFVATIRGRQVSTTRTVLLAVGATAAVVILASTKLLGAFSDTKDEPAGPPSQSTRIPVVP